MKKIILIVLTFTFSANMLSSCKKFDNKSIEAKEKTYVSNERSDNIIEIEEEIPIADKSNKNIIEIKERMFATQVNDVYVNSKDYLGKTIKYEGVFKLNKIFKTEHNTVIRYGPGGCCGNDANIGFVVKWEKENASKKYPNLNDWVEVIGILKEYSEDDNKYIGLSLISLKVLPMHGKENVLR